MAEGDVHPDHEAEQEHLRRPRAALDAMVDRAQRALAFGDRSVVEENTAEARIVRAHLAARRAAVDVGRVNLCFGRIDEEAGGD
ncbi:MAG: hypothetical protein ACE5GB_08820, partial [Acidimicrobiales bacterium]